MPQTGVRSGLLLMVIGLFVILRSTRQDSSGRTLVDHILGKLPSTGAASIPVTPAPTTIAPASPKNAGPLSKRYIPTPAPYSSATASGRSVLV